MNAKLCQLKMEMNQELVQKLHEDGAFFVCLGFPSESEFGIDMKSITTGDKFNGVKMIPPGIHFIYYSVENSHGDQSPRIGFLKHFKKQEVVIKKWDSEKEELIDENSTDTTERIKKNLKNINQYLGAYPFDVWDKWKNLSCKISESLADKVNPKCGKIYSVLELKGESKKEKTTEENTETAPKKLRKSKLFLHDEVYEDFLPHLKAVEGTEIRFSKIPDKCYPENSTPSEITKHSLDSSFLFEQIITQQENFSDILGEIQLAFIFFLIGYSFEAFEHWKKLVGIFCSCDEAISKHPDIFSEFMTILNYQLQEVQEDFLVDIVAGSNFVYKNLRIFFRNVQSGDSNGRLKAKAKRFQELLTEKLYWDFSDINEEDDDELPVIVET